MKKKILWVGDAACQSGFAKGTHAICDRLVDDYDLTVLGLNYYGDPHPYAYPIYSCLPGGDYLGQGRLVYMCDLVKPDAIIFQNDPWNIPGYIAQLKMFQEYDHIKRIGAIAVDSLNCRGIGMNELDAAIFWTQFGRTEAVRGGFYKTSYIIPLGVDRKVYQPRVKSVAREALGLAKMPPDSFFVLNVNRNQARKRMDLSIEYFAEWVKKYSIPNAYLFLHAAPTGDQGFDLKSIAQYYGVFDMCIFSTPGVNDGYNEEQMALLYQAADVQVTTTLGEGFGLPTFEGAACGIPQIFPHFSALGELWNDLGVSVPCTSHQAQPNAMSTIGGVADKTLFVRSLQRVYEDRDFRNLKIEESLAMARDPRFSWDAVGQQWLNVLEEVLE